MHKDVVGAVLGCQPVSSRLISIRVTKDVLDLCDERRDLKKKRYEAEGAKECREANRRVQKAVKKAKEDWIGAQCEEIEICLNKKKQQESISAGKGSNLRETG